MWREVMDATDAFELRKHRVTLRAMVAAGGAIAIAFACPTAASMDATAIEAEIANTQSAQVEDDTGDTAPAAIEIAPSPVIEPDPRFFAGAGDGSNGYYPERPAR
jgi:hypothetical protein